MKWFHRHKFVKDRFLVSNLVDDLENPTYSKPFTAAELFMCKCGEKKVIYRNYFGSEVEAHETAVGIQEQALEWLKRPIVQAQVIKFPVIRGGK